MEFKRDWEKTKQRLLLLWKRELLDRCCISVTAPKDPRDPYIEQKPTEPDALRGWYNDAEWILKRNIERFEKTYFAGDALPCIFPYFGTGGHAKYIVPEEQTVYEPDTIWINPIEEEFPDYDFRFDPQTNPVFQRELSIIRYLAEEGEGRFFVGPPDNCGSYDALSQLRGPENLLIDLIEAGQEVKHAAAQMMSILKCSAEYFFSAIKKNNMGGSVHGWMNTWSEGRQLQLQCDLSVMLSKAMFEEFIVPELQETSGWLDNAIYHMDGMEQLRHLDAVLAVPGIQMIQWVQVAGQPPVTEFISQLRKIQQAGRGLVVQIEKKQLKPLLDGLSPRGLNLIVADADSADEADEIVRFAERYPYRREDL